MDAYDMIYAVLDANNNTIRGKTVIQKLVYLSSKKIPALDVPPYKPQYFGPYSPGLAWALDKMVALYFLYEDYPPGYMHDGAKYSLTSDGREISQETKVRNKHMFEQVAKIVSICRRFSGLKAEPLSYASKIHYLLNSHETGTCMSFADAVEYAKELGWKVPKDNVDQGAELLEQLELVTVSK